MNEWINDEVMNDEGMLKELGYKPFWLLLKSSWSWNYHSLSQRQTQ